MTLVPAYGRDYKSKKELLADWNANKDFVIAGFDTDSGRFINKADSKGLRVSIRYAKLTKVCVIPA